MNQRLKQTNKNRAAGVAQMGEFSNPGSIKINK
jgi:hypothetical protein